MELAVSIINIATTFSIFIVGLFTYFRRNSKSILYFSCLTFAIASWLLAQYLAQVVNSSFGALWLIRISFVLSNVLVLFFVYFMQYYASGKLTSRQERLNKILILLAMLVSCGDLSPFSAEKVAANLEGIVTTLGPFYFVKIAFLVFCLIYGIVLFIRNMIRSGKEERRRDYVLGFAISQAIVVSLVITTVFASSAVSQLAIPVTLLIMVVLIAYAIVIHSLFDIRAAVARSVAYLFTLFIIAAIYVTPAVILTTYVLHTPIGPKSVTFLALLSILIAFLFQPLRLKLNKISNKLFFRDYYEPQEVLDKLSNLLVGSVEVHHIVQGSSQILSDSIRPEFVKYALISEENSKKDNYKDLIKKLSKIENNAIVTDELEQNHNLDLYSDLQDLNVALCVRLRTSKEELGYIMLGYKQSGSIYTDVDKRLLGIAADEIAISLQNAIRFEEIQNFNITLQEKIEKATYQLRKANERLKSLDETKDEFISMASHQLRTPLTSMKGYVSMVLEGDGGKISSTQKDLLNQAFASSQRMVYLIADLLNVSRLRTGKFVIEAKPTNLADVIEGEISQLIETAKAKNLELTYDKPKDFPMLMLDETKIRQVIMNFADNSVYYTPAGGHIKVSLVNKPDSVEFTVSDDGIGVPKAEQHHLFGKFYRAGNAKKARPDGTGLGLFMAKKVVVASGGAIIFHSEEGKGSTFGFTFAKDKFKTDQDKAAQEKKKK